MFDIEKLKGDLIICPNSIKLRLLEQKKNLLPIKFMTKDEFVKNYFFSYDNKAIDYLMTKYQYALEVSKTIMKQLYVIDVNKKYSNDRLNNLQNIKKDLIDNNYLTFNDLFKDYIKNKKIVVYGYPFLEKYEEDALSNALIYYEEAKELTNTVTCCETMEEEIVFICEKILELYKNGVSLNNIYLANVSSDYYYTINRMFTYYNIPIDPFIKQSIYGTNIVSEYLNTKKMPGFMNQVAKSLINVLNSLKDIENSSNYDKFLIDSLKNNYIQEKKHKTSVKVLDELQILSDKDYLFILGFNQDVLPKIYKDEDYISDSLKGEVPLYTTKEKNIKEYKNLQRIISNTKNVIISYKKRSNFQTYLKSSFLNDFSLHEEQYIKNITNSNKYNKLLLGTYLDNYYKYNDLNKLLKPLYNSYQIPYKTYNNSFSGIDRTNFLNYINNNLKLSYTSLNAYNLCSFKYYINYILKLDPFKDNFSTVIGNLFHYMFSICFSEFFNFSREWDKYLDNLELTKKEYMFLDILKDTLKKDIEVIKDQEEYTKYNNYLFEKEISIPLNTYIPAMFVGKIDKIMYFKEQLFTNISIVDYKTGSIYTNLNQMKYGLNLQLPIYLYLLHNSNIFDNIRYSGIYLQKVLYPKVKYKTCVDLENEFRNNLKLHGYSTSDLERLEDFDKTYTNSELISGMRAKKDGELYSNVKTLDDKVFDKMIEYTTKIVNDTTENILEAKFDINPKVMDGDNLACKYCKYQDLCFKSNDDDVILKKQDDLSFLGGEDDGLDEGSGISN